MKTNSGFFAMLVAVLIWGNFVLLFHHINYIPVWDIMAHRILWGLIALLIWLGIKGQLGELVAQLRSQKTVTTLLLSAFLVAVNWATFVWSCGNGHVLQAGLGYFIYPLVSIAFGALINHEPLDRLQLLAVGIAALAVLILTIGVGEIPWISLTLAFSFASYGLIKSRIGVRAILSVTIENMLLVPMALIWLFFFAQYGVTFRGDISSGFWLIFAGVFTALSLITFSFATKTIGLAATGMMFFLNPTIQVFNGAFVLGEPLSIWHVIAFPLIWLACGIYCYDLWKRSHETVAIQ